MKDSSQSNSAPSPEKEREAFERHARARGYDIHIYGDGNYADETDELWRAWQARAAVSPAPARHWIPLADSEWVNIVNAPEVLREYEAGKFDIVVTAAVRLTEEKLRSLNAPASPAVPAPAPAGMLDRVKAALNRIESDRAPRSIPADPHSDVDLVLAEVKYWLEGKWPPFWVASPGSAAAGDARGGLQEGERSCDGGRENRFVREVREWAKANRGTYFMPSWDGNRILKYLGEEPPAAAAPSSCDAEQMQGKGGAGGDRTRDPVASASGTCTRSPAELQRPNALSQTSAVEARSGVEGLKR